jgi:DNA replication protein DnaC
MTHTPSEATLLPGLLTELRLPSIARQWRPLAEQADRDGWPAARLLATLFELEHAERAQRRIQRHHADAELPPGKTLATFDFTAAPGLRKAQILALAGSDDWIKAGANLLAFGPSGTGKSHLAAAIATQLIDRGYRVLFSRTLDLVQKLQAARRDLGDGNDSFHEFTQARMTGLACGLEPEPVSVAGSDHRWARALGCG